MTDHPSRMPTYIPMLGAASIVAAVFFAYTGKVWVRFNGWVYRAKEPTAFWGNVASYFVMGACMIAYYFYVTN